MSIVWWVAAAVLVMTTAPATLEQQQTALLNLAMDRYADLLAYVTVNLAEHTTKPEMDLHARRFFDTSARVQGLIGDDAYGPKALAGQSEAGWLPDAPAVSS